MCEPSPEKPILRTITPESSSLPFVRLKNCPVATWLNQMSYGPSRSEINVTNFPSGEIAASSSNPGKSVKRVKWALARGFSRVAGVLKSNQNKAQAIKARIATTADQPGPISRHSRYGRWLRRCSDPQRALQINNEIAHRLVTFCRILLERLLHCNPQQQRHLITERLRRSVGDALQQLKIGFGLERPVASQTARKATHQRKKYRCGCRLGVRQACSGDM